MNTPLQNKSEELIERYVYAVTKQLPAKQRDDIGKEVHSLISDMAAAMFPDGDNSPESVGKVLEELGNPYDLAQKYREKKRYLIGPEYFDLYIFILKIVLAAVSGGLLLALLLQNIVTIPDNPVNAIVNVISEVVNALFGVFAWVTIIFALISYYGDNSLNSEMARIKKGSQWSPRDLPAVPREKTVIKKSEPLFGIVFNVIVLIVFNYAPQIIGIIYSADDATTFISFLNLGNLSNFIVLINVILSINLVKEIARLLEGRHTVRLSVAAAVLSCISLILSVVLFTNPTFWNPDFATEFSRHFGGFLSGGSDLQGALSTALKVFIGVAVFGFIVETAGNFYKAIKYGA